MATDRRVKRDDEATVPVRTTFLRRGQASPVHRHDEPAAWMHVIAGDVVEERWTHDPAGGFVHERRALRGGQAMAAPGDVLHRVRALGDAVLVTTCACGCLSADAVDRHALHVAQRAARADRAFATATAVGEPSPT